MWGAQYVTLQKYFWHPRLVNYFFSPIPPIKLKLVIANRCEITNNNPPRPIIMIGQLETMSENHIIFITFFFGRCYAWPWRELALANCAQILGQNHLIEPNWHVLTFLYPIFIFQVYILNILRATLTINEIKIMKKFS